MGSSLERIEAEVLGLSTEDRAYLVQRLLESLDEETADNRAEVERAWEEEIQRRLAEIEAGTAELIPAEQVFAELQARYRR